MARSAGILISLLTAGLLTAAAAAGAVRVERGKITVGNSFRTRNNHWAVFSCRLENRSDTPRNLRFRVIPQDGYNGIVNELETAVPGQCAMEFSAPIVAGGSDNYTFEVFENGTRLPHSPEYACIVKAVPPRSGLAAFLNDGGETYGNLNDNPEVKDRLFTTTINHRSAVGGRAVLAGLQALIVAEPDFSRWNAGDYNAVLDFVRGGGTIVFSNPAGTLAAARTPLAELLPVTPLGVRAVTAIEGVETLLPGVRRPVPAKEFPFLDAAECGNDGITLARHEGFPLFRESSFGRGRVKFLAFSPNPDNFPDDRSTLYRVQGLLLDDNRVSADAAALRAPLDLFTGFPVPRLGDIARELGMYLLILTVTVGVLLWRRRPAWAWGAGTAIAAGATVLILVQAHRTLGARGALEAELTVRDGNITDRAASLYSPRELAVDIPGDGSFQPIPEVNRLHAFGINSESPLELRTAPDGAMRLASLNVAPRSSRMFRQIGGGGESEPAAATVVELTGTGELRFRERAPLPAPVPESGFLILPGGVRPLKIEGDTYAFAGDDTVFHDPLLGAVSGALECAYPAPQPYIAWIQPLEPSAGEAPGGALRSGRRVTIQPVKIRVATDAIRLPGDFMRLYASDHSTRFQMRAGKFSEGHSFQPEIRVAVGAAPPEWMRGFKPSEVTLTLRLGGAEDLTVTPSLLLADGREMHGKALGGGRWGFTGGDLERAVGPVNGELNFALDSKISRMDSPTDATAIRNWRILDFQVEVRGALPAGRAPLTL